MTVTEFGIIKGSAATLSPELRSALDAALEAQVRWLRLDPAAAGTNATTGGRSWLLQQVEDPGSVLLAATWTTVGQHNEWAATEPNSATIMGAIGQNLYQPKDAGDPGKPVILLHTEGDVFTGPTAAGATALLDSPVVSVTRMFVKAGQKAAFEKAFNENKIYLEQYSAPHTLRGQWRADNEKDESTGENKEEFVLVCGWESVESHYEFAKNPNAGKTAAFTSLLDGRDTKHYRRIL